MVVPNVHDDGWTKRPRWVHTAAGVGELATENAFRVDEDFNNNATTITGDMGEA